MTAQELFDIVAEHWRVGDFRHPEEIVGPRPQGTHKPKWVWDTLTSATETSSFPEDFDRLLRQVAHICHLYY